MTCAELGWGKHPGLGSSDAPSKLCLPLGGSMHLAAPQCCLARGRDKLWR